MSKEFHNEDAFYTWPEHIRKGFEIVYGEAIPPQHLHTFLSRWKTISDETFIRILSEGQGIDRIIAITALGGSELPQVPTLLHPFLESNDPQERWASAIALGTLHEDEAFPVLITMLTEFFPAWQYKQQLSNPDWFDDWRPSIPAILDFWKDTSLIILLRNALLLSIKSEERARQSSTGIFLQTLHYYQDSLTKSLGRRGAFGILTGLPLSKELLEISIVNMVSSYCHIDEKPEQLGYSWESQSYVREAMIKVMEQQFGLSPQEQNAYLDNYAYNLSIRRNPDASM